ncbi:hypothetical protein D3C78_1659110 [compost metagenome]
MDGPGVAAAAIDLLKDHRGFGQAQPGAAIFFGNHRRQPSGLGHGLDEGLWKAFVFIDFAPVLGRKIAAQGAHAFADGIDGVAIVVVHYFSRWAGQLPVS